MTQREKVSILLVDDRPENLLALESVLEDPLLHMVKATSGEEALAHMLDHDFAIVLMDVQMPGLDGFETVELMRGNKRTRHLPVIFLTAISKDWTYVSRGYAFSAVDYLFKPVQPAALKSKVHVFVELYRQRRDLVKAHQEIECTLSALKRSESALKGAKEAAESSNRAKSQFLAHMSHEIRTPMNGVLGMLTMLMDTSLSEEQRDCAEMAHSSAESLLVLINDILDYSRIEADKIDLEAIEFSLRPVINGATECLAVNASAKGLKFIRKVDAQVPSVVIGDPTRLRQVVVNLVNNAIKFTKNGEVAVVATVEREEETQIEVRFSVSDTGVGVPKDRQRNLFRPFSQADGSTTREYGGTGLGLAICKRLVELMGGSIGVKSRADQGSTFWFTVMFAKAQPQWVAVDTGRLEKQHILHILIVDDDATCPPSLRSTLHRWGCRTRQVGSVSEALSTLHSAASEGDPFDVAVVDEVLPDGRGDALGQIIKADPDLHDTRLVMLTPTGAETDAARLREIGFAANLTQPVGQDELRDCLASVVSQTPPPIPVTPAHGSEQSLGQSVKMLLVEDNRINQMVALKFLEKLGRVADVAGNGLEAVERVGNQHYDVILMDCQMPVMDGYDATAAIRRLERPGRPVRIIAMTADAMKGNRERCLAAGMDDYITKPVELADLARVIDPTIDDSSPSRAVWLDPASPE